MGQTLEAFRCNHYVLEAVPTVPIIDATKVEETTAPDNAMIY